MPSVLNADVSSFGDTEDEALKNLQEALGLYIEDAPYNDNVPDVTHPSVSSMPKLLSSREIFRIFEQQGFVFVSQRRSHAKYRKRFSNGYCAEPEKGDTTRYDPLYNNPAIRIE